MRRASKLPKQLRPSVKIRQERSEFEELEEGQCDGSTGVRERVGLDDAGEVCRVHPRSLF